MSGQKTTAGGCLGFLRVLELDGGGFLGGVLVTNQIGRPLEFQCTTPVKPNRTQVILYGPTLAPFVYSELIGKTLFGRLDIKPQLIIVDQDALLDLRLHVPAQVARLANTKDDVSELPDELKLQCGRHHLSFHSDFPQDRDDAAGLLAALPGDADLREPLERVTEALKETLRTNAVA
ncbi:MAG: hypothetical protein JNG89_21335 [Planctomycetaceae bacterium]|nr:hypothetical protein [Planctomycetaceae bacterium]